MGEPEEERLRDMTGGPAIPVEAHRVRMVMATGMDGPGQVGRSHPRTMTRRFCAAFARIYSGDYEEALHVLSMVDIHDRTVRWYYYSALAYRYQGKLKLAEEAALRAVEMDPANLMYRRLLIEIRTPEVKRAPA